MFIDTLCKHFRRSQERLRRYIHTKLYGSEWLEFLLHNRGLFASESFRTKQFGISERILKELSRVKCEGRPGQKNEAAVSYLSVIS